MDLMQRLVRDLREEHSTILDVALASGFVLDSYRNDVAPRPIRVHATAASIAEYLEDLADARDVFPEVDDAEARYRLFLVHLDETISTMPDTATELTIDCDGIVAR